MNATANLNFPHSADDRLPTVVIGYGGHGRVVAAALLAAGEQVLAATDLHPEAVRPNGLGIEVISDDELTRRFDPSAVRLTLGIGSIWPANTACVKYQTVKKFTALGYQFVGFRHPTAWIAPSVTVASTAQIHAGVIVQPGAFIGEFAIVNTGATVDHDCTVSDHCHIGPGVTLSGNVQIKKDSHIGTGANIVQGLKLGVGCFVAAGATVVKDVPDGCYVRGVPAHEFQPKQKAKWI